MIAFKTLDFMKPLTDLIYDEQLPQMDIVSF